MTKSQIRETCIDHPEGGKRHLYIHCRCDMEAKEKEIQLLRKTVGTTEHVTILQEAFQRDWKANFEKVEAENDQLRTRLNKAVEALKLFALCKQHDFQSCPCHITANQTLKEIGG